MAASFYRRPLPETSIAFASEEGKLLFKEALADGTMECFFALSEQFHTQSEPAFCGLGSLVMALNALAIDPGRMWKGPWRWFDETLLDCCVPLDVVKQRGLTLSEIACLASCNGARAERVNADRAPASALRAAVSRASRLSAGGVLIAAYNRGSLGQTGSGHYSPIAGYHQGRDLALVLDVARFKYPPHWIPIETLHQAMLAIDGDTGRSRGWLWLTAAEDARPLFVTLGVPVAGWRTFFEGLRAEVEEASRHAPADIVWAKALADMAPSLADIVRPAARALHGSLAPEHARAVEALLGEIRNTTTFRAVSTALRERAPESAQIDPEVVALVALVLMGDSRTELGPNLEREVCALDRQLKAVACAVP
ncbi:MAG: phytochelatin synthase family protein [Polyangiaceae bacterium]